VIHRQSQGTIRWRDPFEKCRNFKKETRSMSLLMILLTIFLPPVAVALKEGLGVQLLINIVLTLIGWLPGVVHAFWINSRNQGAVA